VRLLPFHLSVLGTPSPAVTSANLLYIGRQLVVQVQDPVHLGEEVLPRLHFGSSALNPTSLKAWITSRT
jgi:hypothetical protein